MKATTGYVPEPLQEAIDLELFAAKPIKILEHNYQPVGGVRDYHGSITSQHTGKTPATQSIQ